MGCGGSERTCVLTNGLRPETDGLSKRKSLVELDVDAVGLEVRLSTSTGSPGHQGAREEDLKFKIVACCKKEREMKKRREGQEHGGWINSLLNKERGQVSSSHILT